MMKPLSILLTICMSYCSLVGYDDEASTYDEPLTNEELRYHANDVFLSVILSPSELKMIQFQSWGKLPVIKILAEVFTDFRNIHNETYDETQLNSLGFCSKDLYEAIITHHVRNRRIRHSKKTYTGKYSIHECKLAFNDMIIGLTQNCREVFREGCEEKIHKHNIEQLAKLLIIFKEVRNTLFGDRPLDLVNAPNGYDRILPYIVVMSKTWNLQNESAEFDEIE